MASAIGVSVGEKMKMTDTSLDTLETSYDTTTLSQTTDTTKSDDDDDELLALRIAALESIKLQKAKPQQKVSKQTEEEKPDFVIKSHPKRSNLLSIVTCEEPEPEVPNKSSSPPPASIPYFDPTRPPPRFGLGPRLSRSPFGRRSRSPGFYRRFGSRSRSRSPGRRPWSRSPPPHYRRRSLSPYRRRRSFSRSPPRRSPRRRSPPGPRADSPPLKERSPSPSEWETDTETEEEEEKEENKNEEEVKDNEASNDKSGEELTVKKEEQKKKPVNNDDEGDDILKLDATAEEDEFSAFLNEFEDEVLSKKEEKKETVKKEKKERPPTEKKVVDGKKLRKKIKPKKASPPPPAKRSRSKSPRLGVRSPGRRYFSPNRGKDSRLSPKRREDRKSRERSSKSKEKSLADSKPSETAAERAAREQREYEERMAKLPTPERERMEARRKKFEKKIDTNKKISLKSDKSGDGGVDFEVKKRGNKEDDVKDDDEDSPPVRRNVTDLRVQLHKKRKAHDDKPEKPGLRGNNKHPLARSLSPTPDLDEEDFGPVEKSDRRKVLAASDRNVLKTKMRHSEELDSDRSPSPLQKMLSRKRKSSGDSGDNVKGRRILVVRKGDKEEDDLSITRTTNLSPSKGLKKSLHMRLGGKVGAGGDDDIYMNILREQEIKKKNKKVRRKRRRKKDKKSKKKQVESDDEEDRDSDNVKEDSDEELYRFFEDQPESKKEKRKSGDKVRQSSGEKVKKRFVRAKFDDDLDLMDDEKLLSFDLETKKKDKIKRRTSNEGSLDEESSDLLEKMRRKNEKRLKRMKEIERD